MNMTLHGVPPAHGGDHGIEVRHSAWRRLQGVIDRTSQRRASRQVGLMAEQETDRLWFWRLMRLEVDRARRRDSGFSVLCIRDDDDKRLTQDSHLLRPHVRATDALTTERGRMLILLSETSGVDALHVTNRLSEHLAIPRDAITWQEVSFPRDALTLGALIECLLGDDAGEHLLLAG